MRLVLSHALFGAPNVDAGNLLQLILACRRPSAHFVALTSVWRPGTQSHIDRWLDLWPESLKQTLREVLGSSEESARRGRALTIVVVEGRSDWDPPEGKGLRLNVADALTMLRAPLHVLVENRRNDGRFVARFAIMLKTDEDRTLFERALRDGWIIFEQGGGLSEVQHMLEDLEPPKDDPVQCPQGTRRHVRRWRLTVVIDRDALDVRRPSGIPKDQWVPRPRDVSMPSSESELVVLAAQTALRRWNGLPAVHQLRRRAIENYIPLPTLWRWVDREHDRGRRESRRAKVEGLAALSASDAKGDRPRWYFNMKSGLGGDKPARLNTPATQDVHVHEKFHALTEQQRVDLQDGFDTRDESIADLLFDRSMTPDGWLRDELSLEADEPADLLYNLLNRL